MSFSGTIIFRKKDAVIPEDFLKVALEHNPTFASSVFCEDDGSMTADAVAEHTVQDLMEAQELVKDRPSVFFMGKYPDEYPEESLQPFYVLRDEKDNPVLSLFLDGEFGNYHGEKSANSEAYHAMVKYFQPKAERWFKKGGLENVLEELNDAVTCEDIRNSFMGRGAAVFMARTGEVILIQSKNPPYKEFKWGWATNAYGYEEEKQEEQKASAPVAGPKKLTIKSKKTEDKEEQINTEAANDKEAKSEDKAPFPDKNKKTEEQAAKRPTLHVKKPDAKVDADGQGTAPTEATGNTLVVGWKPNWGINPTRKEKAKAYATCPFYDTWIKQYKGKLVESDVIKGKMLPEGYKNHVPMFVEVSHADATGLLEKGCFLKDAPGKVSLNGKKEQGYPERVADKSEEATVKPKDTSVHNKEIEASALPISEEEKGAGYVEFENPELKKWFTEANKTKFIADIGNAEISIDPAKIQSLENNIPDAVKAAGLDDVLDMARVSIYGHMDLAKNFPTWYAQFTCQLMYKLLRTLPKDQRPKPSEVREENKEEETVKEVEGATKTRPVLRIKSKKVA